MAGFEKRAKRCLTDEEEWLFIQLVLPAVSKRRCKPTTDLREGLCVILPGPAVVGEYCPTIPPWQTVYW